jgi:hypothetical protein
MVEPTLSVAFVGRWGGLLIRKREVLLGIELVHFEVVKLFLSDARANPADENNVAIVTCGDS